MNRKDLTTGPFAALSPVDGRYRRYAAPLVNFLSEAALNRERIFVEIEWVLALCDGLPKSGFAQAREPQIPGLPALTNPQKAILRGIVADFDASSVDKLAETEAWTKHDVKAIEYYIKDEIEQLETSGVFDAQTAEKIGQAIHIFCTSEDINNLSYALCIKRAVENAWLPKMRELIEVLKSLANENLATPMLAKTHGQPATPVTLGKEIAVFVSRLSRQVRRIESQEYLGKINGATGTFGAHFVSVPSSNWPEFAAYFVENCLELTYNPITTQIESHDWQVELYSALSHAGNILHNFATDIWTYISNEVFIQIPEPGATGSSTMPHKINPIKFENAEANLEISAALFGKLQETLVTSRMQRDLTDSTTQRNIGVAFGHSLIALQNLIDGTKALEVNKEHLLNELRANPAVLGEAIQSAMRAAGIAGEPGMESPYERLKEFTRGKEITFSQMQEFVKQVGFSPEFEARLAGLEPEGYIGLAEQIAKEALANN